MTVTTSITGERDRCCQLSEGTDPLLTGACLIKEEEVARTYSVLGDEARCDEQIDIQTTFTLQDGTVIGTP